MPKTHMESHQKWENLPTLTMEATIQTASSQIPQKNSHLDTLLAANKQKYKPLICPKHVDGKRALGVTLGV